MSSPGQGRRAVLAQVSTLTAISAATMTVSTIGLGLLAGLLPTRPEILLALSPSNLVLLLVAHRIGLGTYLTIGSARLIVATIAPYLLGYLYGRRGVELVVRRDRHRQLIDQHTGRLRPFAVMAMFLWAGVVVAAVAGLVRVRPVWFALLDVVGAGVRLVLFWWLAGLFADQLDLVVELVERWQWVLLAVGVVVAVGVSVTQHRRAASRPMPIIEAQ